MAQEEGREGRVVRGRAEGTEEEGASEIRAGRTGSKLRGRAKRKEVVRCGR